MSGIDADWEVHMQGFISKNTNKRNKVKTRIIEKYEQEQHQKMSQGITELKCDKKKKTSNDLTEAHPFKHGS